MVVIIICCFYFVHGDVSNWKGFCPKFTLWTCRSQELQETCSGQYWQANLVFVLMFYLFHSWKQLKDWNPWCWFLPGTQIPFNQHAGTVKVLVEWEGLCLVKDPWSMCRQLAESHFLGPLQKEKRRHLQIRGTRKWFLIQIHPVLKMSTVCIIFLIGGTLEKVRIIFVVPTSINLMRNLQNSNILDFLIPLPLSPVYT